MRGVLSLLVVSAALVGCYSPNSKSADSRVPLGSKAPASTALALTGGLTGKVVERLDAPPYTYLRIATAEGEVWTAVPETKVEKGASVTVQNPMAMANFESKTLKRTFPEIYFGTLNDGSAVGGAGAAAGAAPGGNPHTGAPVAVASATVGKVAKAEGADAHTIAEVWAGKASLKGKTVTIRGVVVKYNDAVMGKNWIHLQDGSGDTTKGTHDITFTSTDQVAKGDTVTLRGTLRTDKDFGSGYAYAVIVEEAKVVKK